MYIEDRLFSETSGEVKYYSVAMTEDEYALYTEFQKEFGKVKEANKALKKVWESSGANAVLVGPRTKGQFRKINASGTTLTKHELKRGIGVAIKDGEKHIYLAPSSTTNHSINSKGIEDALGYNKNEHMGLAKRLHNDPDRGTNTHIWWK
jgi:hypothetical protein